MATERDLAWEGCANVRDLGGLMTADGRTIRPGAVVRADSPHLLTDAGWQQAWDHGVRTVVDLRHPGERNDAPRGARPEGIGLVHAPIEVEDDLEFLQAWGHQLGTPRYYPAALERYAALTAGAVRAVATAPPGGVLVHCVAGRDRTGLVTLLLLALAGVPASTIAADHAASYDLWPVDDPDAMTGGAGDTGAVVADAAGPSPADRSRTGAGTGEPPPVATDEAAVGDLLDPNAAAVGVADRPTDWCQQHDATITALLASLDVEAYLRDAGLGDDHLHALRIRLLGAGPTRPTGVL